MANLTKTITAVGSKGHHTFELYLEEQNVTGGATNTSDVYYKFHMYRTQSNTEYDWSGWGSNISYSFTINGTTFTGTIPDYNGYSKTLKTGTLSSISHDSNGSKTISISFSVTDGANKSYTCGNASASGTFTLTSIPRYATINSFTVTNVQEQYMTLSWSTDSTIDYWWWSKDGGSNWNAVGNPSGTSSSINLTSNNGLAESTSYTLKVKVRRSDSQLITESTNISKTTYNYPKPTGSSNFTIGSSPTITVSNPLGRNINLYLYKTGINPNNEYNNYIGKYTGSANGNITTAFKTADDIDRMYKSIPSATSSTYYCVVVYSGIPKNYSGNNTYQIKNSDDEKPTFTSSYITSLTNTSTHSGLGDGSFFIKGYNYLNGSITPMGLNKHASGNKYNISASGLSTVTKNYSSNPQSFALGNVTTSTFTVTAIDARGLSRTVTIDLGSKFIDYYKPYITEFVAARDQNGIGTSVTITVTGKFMDWISGNNGLSVANSIVGFKYKIGNGSWSNSWITPTFSTNTGSNWKFSYTIPTSLAIDSKFDIYFQIKDKLGNIVSSAITETGSYEIGSADALLWRDLYNKRLGIRKKPSCELDVNGKIKGIEFSTGGNDKAPWNLYLTTINLTSSTYNTGTYYPVYTNNPIPYGGLHRIIQAVQLNSGVKPSWSTHNSGFTSVVDVLSLAGGWGTTDGTTIILKDYNSFISSSGKACWYQQLTNSSKACFYLRGGGKYYLYTDWKTDWTICTSTTTISSQEIKPETSAGNSVGNKLVYGSLATVATSGSYNDLSNKPTIPTKVSQLTNDSSYLVKSNLLNYVYPVGSIYMSVNNTSPASFLGGTWQALTDRFLIGAGSSYSVNGTGGSTTHSHGLTAGYTYANCSGAVLYFKEKSGVTSWTNGSGMARNLTSNSSSTKSTTYAWQLGGTTDSGSTMPPYLAVYMWKRTA